MLNKTHMKKNGQIKKEKIYCLDKSNFFSLFSMLFEGGAVSYFVVGF